MTVVCVAVGTWAHRSREQQRGVEQLEAIGVNTPYYRLVTISYDRLPSSVPEWLLGIFGQHYFRSAETVTLNSNETITAGKHDRLTPAQLCTAVEAMQRLPCLDRLIFQHTGIEDKDLALIAPLSGRLRRLKVMMAYDSEFTGQGIEHLAGWPRLKELSISVDNFNVESLPLLTKLPALEKVVLRGELDAAAFSDIAQCEKLEALFLSRCSFDMRSLAKLRSAPKLKDVYLSYCEVRDLSPTQPIDGVVSEAVNYAVCPGKYALTHPDPVVIPADFKAARRPTDNEVLLWLQRLAPGITFKLPDLSIGP